MLCNSGTAGSGTNRSAMPYHPSRPVTTTEAAFYGVAIKQQPQLDVMLSVTQRNE